MFGPIIAAPLAKPTMWTSPVGSFSVRDAVFGCVSVVMIAVAARSRPSGDSSRAAAAIAGSIFGIGSSRPMTPVEATRNCSGRTPTALAASSVMRRASARPCSPVQALALPEQTTKPRTVARGEPAAADLHRSGTDAILREDAGGGGRAIADDEGDIEPARFVGPNSSGDGGEAVSVHGVNIATPGGGPQ